jgi:hypothetical protein
MVLEARKGSKMKVIGISSKQFQVEELIARFTMAQTAHQIDLELLRYGQSNF